MTAADAIARQSRRLSSVAEPVLVDVARRVVRQAARRIEIGCLTVVEPDGRRRRFGDPASERTAEIRVHDEAAYVRLLVDGETGAGEAYMDGQWSSPDLVGLIELATLNRQALALAAGWWRFPAQARRTVEHRLRSNSHAGSRRNIVAHYDLGNDFYRLWLDETMTYSCAVFETPGQPLADAQRNKLARIAARAGIAAGDHVLEIGTGWGSFARYAAAELGCRVTTITISPSQAELARERIREAGLADRVDVRLQDYRDLAGEYDAIVSIEMLEAVGDEYFATFFETCDRVLRPGGRLSLQTITFPDASYESQRRGANWIQRYIFPGGLLPSLAVIERATNRTGLIVTDVDDIGAHYAPTLRAWRSAFLGNLPAVRAMGFDDRFVRMWEYYLALSEAGFRVGGTQDLQIVFEKRRGQDLPARRP